MKHYFLLAIIFTTLVLAPKVHAATLRTDTNPPATTRVGNPTTSSSSLAMVAAEIANTINKNCNGYARSTNMPCWNGLSFPDVPHKNEAISAIASSVTINQCNDPGLGNCVQCVGLVQAAVGGATGQYLDKGGDAAQYATNIPDGYQYITNANGAIPQDGDIIIKTGTAGDPAGHIAIVTKVYGSNLVDVAEGNYNFNGQVAVNNVPLSLWAGWLRKQ